MTERVDPVLVYVQGFLDTYGNDCGRRLHEIAGAIGLTIKEVNAESFDGALIRVVGRPRGKIAINANIREPGRKRFTLAHELGHYVLPSHSRQSVTCRPAEIERWTTGMSQPELEANRFAAALLMPKPLIMEALRPEPSLEQARRIAAECQVSLTAAAYRLVELSTYPVAVVWNASGRRLWFQRSEEFERAVELGPCRRKVLSTTIFMTERPFPPGLRPCPQRPGSMEMACWRTPGSGKTPYRCLFMTRYSPCYSCGSRSIIEIIMTRCMNGSIPRNSPLSGRGGQPNRRLTKSIMGLSGPRLNRHLESAAGGRKGNITWTMLHSCSARAATSSLTASDSRTPFPNLSALPEQTAAVQSSRYRRHHSTQKSTIRR